MIRRRVIQAGWLDGDARYGLAVRGTWSAAGHALSSNDGRAWLVLFAYDRRHQTVRRLQIRRDERGRLSEEEFIDGRPTPIDEASRSWVLSSLRTLRRAAPPDFGLPTVP